MSNRAVRFAAIMSLIVAMAVPVVGFAAPATGNGGLTPQEISQQTRHPFQIWPGWGYKPWRGTGLDYSLHYSAEDNELVLYVFNNTRSPITVTTPTSQTVDFALWKDGKLAWRASAGKSYLQAVTNETFKPGEGRSYKGTLPWLPTGTYFAQAYFLGETKWHPVASTYIWMRAYEPVQYSIDYLAPNWFNRTPRLRVTIKNVSGKDITLPYQYGYQILVKKVGAREYLGHVGMGQSLGTLANGATRTVFVNLNNLGPGAYQADVRANTGTGRYVTMASTWFSVW